MQIVGMGRANEILDIREHITFGGSAMAESALVASGGDPCMEIDRYALAGVGVACGVDAGAAVDYVGAIAAQDQVIAAESEDPVIATEAENHVGLVGDAIVAVERLGIPGSCYIHVSLLSNLNFRIRRLIHAAPAQTSAGAVNVALEVLFDESIGAQAHGTRGAVLAVPLDATPHSRNQLASGGVCVLSRMITPSSALSASVLRKT